MELSLKIKTLRKQNNFSVEQLAKQIGVSRQIIYDYESGRVKPGLDKIRLLSQVLGIDFDELQRMSTNENPKGPAENIGWYKNLLDEMREEKRRLQDQVDRLTRMLENQLGKPFDVTLGGLATRESYMEAKVVSIDGLQVANSVAS